jgi:hypothetical protein
MLPAILLIQGLALAIPQSAQGPNTPDSAAAFPSLARSRLEFASFQPALPVWMVAAATNGATAFPIVVRHAPDDRDRVQRPVLHLVVDS